MGIKAPASVKFQMIQDVIAHDNNLLSITELCQIAGVSHSGYYDWVHGASNRQAREDADRKDFDLILEAYRFRGYAKGGRSIHMRLLHVGIRMNVKKIRRLMKKYKLICPIRRPNPFAGWQGKCRQIMWHRMWLIVSFGVTEPGKYY